MTARSRKCRETPCPPPPPGAPGRCVLLKAGFGMFQPDIWIVDADGTPRVWKTWQRRPAPERLLIGRRLARREGLILQALAGLERVPRFVAWPQPYTLEMSLLSAEPVPETKGDRCALSALYFERLWVMLEHLHAHGIHHGDLRRKNLLRAPNDCDTPLLIDFTQSLHVRMPARGIRGWALREAIHIDRVTFLKLKRWYLGTLSPEEQRELDSPPWHLRLGRTLRKGLYRPVRRWLRDG